MKIRKLHIRTDEGILTTVLTGNDITKKLLKDLECNDALTRIPTPNDKKRDVGYRVRGDYGVGFIVNNNEIKLQLFDRFVIEVFYDKCRGWF